MHGHKLRLSHSPVCRYLESEECTKNLAKYEKHETLLHTVRNRVTKLVTQVPGLLPAEGQPIGRWLKLLLLRAVSFGGRAAAGWLVVSNILWGASRIAVRKSEPSPEPPSKEASAQAS